MKNNILKKTAFKSIDFDLTPLAEYDGVFKEHFIDLLATHPIVSDSDDSLESIVAKSYVLAEVGTGYSQALLIRYDEHPSLDYRTECLFNNLTRSDMFTLRKGYYVAAVNSTLQEERKVLHEILVAIARNYCC